MGFVASLSDGAAIAGSLAIALIGLVVAVALPSLR